MDKRLLITLLSMLLPFFIYAQSGWQWARLGNTFGMENKVEIIADQNDNIYVLAVGQDRIRHGKNHHQCRNQINLTKWDCNGNLIWIRQIGGDGAILASNSALAMDSLGGIYFTGTMFTEEGEISFDTGNTLHDISQGHTIHDMSQKKWYIVKYDTTGTLQWIQTPQSDTVSSLYTAHKSVPLGLDVSPQGDVYVLAHLAPGVFSDTYISTSYQTFRLMRYNKDGEFIDAQSVDMSVPTWRLGSERDLELSHFSEDDFSFARDHQSGQFYLSGSAFPRSDGHLTFGSTAIIGHSGNPAAQQFSSRPIYLAAFDSNGHNLWVQQTDPAMRAFSMYSRPQIDEQGNVYICGVSEQGNTFFNHTIMNTYKTSGMTLFVLSVDKNGQLRWGKNSITGNAYWGLGGLDYANGIISVSDVWTGFLSWGTDIVKGASPDAYYNHLSRFNAHSGMPISIDTLRTTIDRPNVTNICSDKKGNIYIGGLIKESITLPTHTVIGSTYLKEPGGSDFYVIRYGSDNCSCILSTPDFSYSMSTDNNNTVNFHYTGSTDDVDSIRWEFGGDAVADGFTVNHTYNSPGVYGTSIVVYSQCGIQSYYKEIIVTDSALSPGN